MNKNYTFLNPLGEQPLAISYNRKPSHLHRSIYALFVLACSLLQFPMVTQAQSGNKESSPARQWDNVVGSKGPDYLSSMLVTQDGGYLLSGYSSSGIGED